MIRKTLAAAVALISLSACTPAEHAAWVQYFKEKPTEAKVELAKLATAPVPAKAPMGSKCPNWYDEAMSAGFSFNQWHYLDKIMWRESRCNPGVRNHRSGSTGLVQIMPMWADDCNTTVAGLRNGQTNLRCAKHILDVQGWAAWA